MRQSRATRMSGRLGAIVAPALALAVAFGGCGGSSGPKSSPEPERGPSTAPAAAAASASSTPTGPPPPPATINATIPVLTGSRGTTRTIPARYTCDGANVSLPAQWSNIPHGTAEIVIFLLDLRPIHGKAFFDWAVAGLSPTSHGFPAGSLPPGAVVGRNSYGDVGYSICPAKGVEEDFAMRVLALPHRLAATPGFEAEAFYNEAEKAPLAVGLTGGLYTRR
jgi:phosphatidylethanolamine-binding protein (PEBP) family uncharacterized protein